MRLNYKNGEKKRDIFLVTSYRGVLFVIPPASSTLSSKKFSGFLSGLKDGLAFQLQLNWEFLEG